MPRTYRLTPVSTTMLCPLSVTRSGGAGTDLSLGMLREGLERGVPAPLIQADMAHLPFRKGSFRGLWVCASLLHIPKVQAGDVLRELERGRDLAMANKLVVHAGHGLTYRNIAGVARIKDLCEFNIGHSIIARALFVGIRQATAEMIKLIDKFSAQG